MTSFGVFCCFRRCHAKQSLPSFGQHAVKGSSQSPLIQTIDRRESCTYVITYVTEVKK